MATLTLTALFLLVPARRSMSPVAAFAILLHVLLGFILIPAMVRGALTLYQRAQALSRGAQAAVVLLSLLLLVSAASGVSLTAVAALGHSTSRLVGSRQGHIFAGFAAIALYCLYSIRFATGQSAQLNPRVSAMKSAPGAPPAASALVLIFVLTLVFLVAVAGAEYLPADYYRFLTATNAAQAQNPNFPAGLSLTNSLDGPNNWHENQPDYCGRNGCHNDVYAEWNTSAHRYASTDPVYMRAAADYAVSSPSGSVRWCQGCHDPYRVVASVKADYSASLLTAQAAAANSNASGASSGVDCVSCHSQAQQTSRSGNGQFTLSVQASYPFSAASGGWKRSLHEFLMRVRPSPHTFAYSGAGLSQRSDMCVGCHRQTVNVAQNNYQTISGPDEYGEWASGPCSGENARFADSRKPQACADCHFPQTTLGRRSHLSLGANTLLPALRKDTAGLARAQAFLAISNEEKNVRKKNIAIDIFAMRRVENSRTGANRSVQEQWTAPLDAPVSIPSESAQVIKPGNPRPGDTVSIDVVVTNRDCGHSFPAGYQDIEEAWIELTVLDSGGRVLLENGLIADLSSPLAPDTHVYREVALDRNGNEIRRHELSRKVTTLYRYSVPSGGSDIARYQFTLPRLPSARNAIASSRLRVHARLRYRAVSPIIAGWVFGRSLPSIPVTTIAEDEVALPEYQGSLNSRAATIAPSPVTDTSSRDILAARFVGYGDGLMSPRVSPDVSRAIRAYRIAQALAPLSPSPRVGLSRAYLTEPDLQSAGVEIREALKLDPANPGALEMLGLVLRKQGQYDGALSVLEPLGRRFPEDSVLHDSLGLALTETGRVQDAARSFQMALSSDPGDSAAHFQLERCYQLLRRVPDARREEAILGYLAEDRLAPILDPIFLARHPGGRIMMQPIPEHRLKHVATARTSLPLKSAESASGR